MLNAETYVTNEKGIGGTIREHYEDFYVEEIPNITPSGDGPNVWIWIEKLGRTTLDVLLDISRDLHISRKRMGFAGMKDKKAVTRQWICISNINTEEDFNEIKNLNIYNTKFLKIVRGQKKLRMGQLSGNKFRILIKNPNLNENNDNHNINRKINNNKNNSNINKYTEETEIAINVLKQLEKVGVPNYFGWQRFGKPRTNTHLVGRALTLNDLKEAVRIYIGNPTDDEREDIKIARDLYDQGKLEESYDAMSSKLRYERMMLRILIKEEKKGELTDKSYIKAIHALPKPLQRMFVHSYQSYLFNKAVSRRIAMGIDKYIEGDILIDNEEHIVYDKTPKELQDMITNFKANPTSPLYGTKVPLASGEVGEMEENVLKEENLTKKSFECPKTPKLGSFGIRRATRFKVWDTNATATDEGVLTEFSINKGSYATAVLREIMKNEVV
jgi:tRNA pseudouridine13 synthase